MIPKKIHYCWFGKGQKPKLAKKCIASWKKYCPDYEIKEWNESNFDINSNEYVKEAYQAKKWAFVSDYVRLYALVTEGGIYLDADAELLNNIDEYLNEPAFSGFESDEDIPTAIMGSEQDGEWVRYLLSYYDNRHFLQENGQPDMTTNVTTITNMTKEKYQIHLDNSYQTIENILTLFPKDYFCPKSYETGEINLTERTVCIHHFNASWFGKADQWTARKRNYFLGKYGKEKGKEKFKKWCHRNRYLIFYRKYGWKITGKKAMKKIRNIIFRH